MGFLELLAIFVVSSIIAILLRPRLDLDENGPADFRPPAPREGAPIPVVFGTVKLSPAVTWFGDVGFKQIVKKESALLGLVSEEIPLGYDYSAGMQLVVCHGPIDALVDIHIGEHHVAQRPVQRVEGARYAVPRAGYENVLPALPIAYTDGVPTDIFLNMPTLFGGAEEGGGITGFMDWHWGSESQGQNAYLAAFWGDDILPQYRGICYAVLNRVNFGKNPQPQPWHFVIKRIPKVLAQDQYSEITDADGNGTANGAECIYDLLTDTRWGVGMAAADIDVDTFRTAAQTLHTESLGYNGQYVQRTTAWSAIKQILDHTNGVLYQDPLTGQLGLKLIREDYVLANLPEFNESNAVLDQFTRGSWAEIVNETAVKYIDIGRRFSDGSAQAQNLAAIQAMDEIVTAEISLPGLSTHELAQDAASRLNRATSVPVTRGRLTATRFGHDLFQGAPFKIDFPHFGISGLPCRVVSINYGSLLEGRLEIEFIEDPFNHVNPYASPDDLTDNVWCGPLALIVDGYDAAADPAASFGEGWADVFEAPYWHDKDGARRAWALASRSTNQDLHWFAEISEKGTPFSRTEYVRFFTPIGLLEADLDITGAQTGVSLTIRNLGEMESLTSTDATGRVAGERLAIIDNGFGREIIAWETITDNGDGTYTITNVMRGVLDTVPLQHNAGARALFYYSLSGGQSAYDVSTEDYAKGDPIGLRAIRADLEGSEQSPLRSKTDWVTMTDRAIAPYPPGRVTLNTNQYPAWPATTSGDVTLGWTHRNRTAQTSIVAQDDATAYSLVGDLDIEVLIEGHVVRTFAAVTGTSQVYTWAQRQADDADTSKKVQFRIKPMGVSNEEGWVRTTPAFTMGA